MDSKTISAWGTIAVSIVAFVAYLTALLVSYFLKNETMMNTLIVVAATNATTVVSYWLGSSAGSQNKNETLSKLVAPSLTKSI